MIETVELFGGIGNFGNGIERVSDIFEIVDYIEKDKFAVKSYNAINNTNYEPRNAKEVSKYEIEEHDLLCAGFPCQSFSIAGERRGFDDKRGNLFFEVIRFAEYGKPEILLLENVQGLLSHDGGRTFGVILSELEELGYDVEWQCIDSRHYSVPQNRKRVFIVGHLDGFERSGGVTFPISGEERADKEEAVIHPTFTAQDYVKMGQAGGYLDSIEAISRVSDNVRRATPKEAWRLQNISDDKFEKARERGLSNTQLYKQAGNSVTVSVVEKIGEKLVKHFSNRGFDIDE